MGELYILHPLTICFTVDLDVVAVVISTGKRSTAVLFSLIMSNIRTGAKVSGLLGAWVQRHRGLRSEGDISGGMYYSGAL
jgi:hypothetical protein